ncbi:MAG: U32 family peptidase [Lachnospiraceae bacterium]
MKRFVEILAPAGSWDSLLAAVSAGADAVYIGGNRFGARAYAENLSEEELLKAIDYVHIHGRKIYLTVNTLLKNEELNELYEYLLPYYERGLDAVIVQDVGVMDYIRSCFPDLAIHVSTQATVTSTLSAGYFKNMGVQRIVPARELNLEEIRHMKKMTGLEIECFVHGALCYCYSGQCLLSSMIGGRSGNRGQCAQPCRLPYSVKGGKKQDLLSLKDLCTIDMIPDLIEAGIDSFKIEGRMKQPDYVYTVVSLYRKYVDLYLNYGKKQYFVSENDKKQLENAYRRRGYTEGYYRQHNGKDMLSLKRPKEERIDSPQIFETKIKEKFNGKLILSKGESVKLYLVYDGISVKCEGAVVQEAKNQPLDQARIEKQMRKTGTTEFEFDCLEITMDDDVFLPMQALNELRREAISMLEEKILSAFRRKSVHNIEFYDKDRGMEKAWKEEENIEISVLVSDVTHFRQVKGDRRIDTVYVESDIAFSSESEKKCGEQKIFLAMPFIFRENTIQTYEALYDKINKFFDGVLVRNLDSFQWLLEHGYSGEIRLDYNVYTFNQRSKDVFKRSRVSRFCAPCELNYKELLELDVSGGILIGYGRQPVMITANCVRKNTEGCTQKEGLMYLTDRYQKKFAVKNCCRYCYNIIYNCQPLMLLSQHEEIKKLNPKEIRLDFLAENKEETEQMIRLYWTCFKKNDPVQVPDMDFTRGHFKRGVK